MEYGNSVIYDEYPDRLQLQLMCGRIYENVRKNEERYLEIEKNAQLKDMIELMLYQELYNQRCRNRRTRESLNLLMKRSVLVTVNEDQPGGILV